MRTPVRCEGEKGGVGAAQAAAIAGAEAPASLLCERSKGVHVSWKRRTRIGVPAHGALWPQWKDDGDKRRDTRALEASGAEAESGRLVGCR